MNCYSHWEAAKILGIPYLDLFFPDQLQQKPDVTVTSRRERFRSKTHNVHLCSVELPERAIIFANGYWVSSPGFLFMQLCYEVDDIQKAILIGSLMCSPDSFGNPPLITLQALTDFVYQARHVRGRPRALDAIRYLEENFRSPMEVLLYMFFCLPYNLGGCCFRKKVKINGMVLISRSDANRLGLQSCFVRPDLLFPEDKVVIEYNGKDYHSSGQQTARDATRREILEKMGYKVIEVRAYDLYNLENFAQLCHEVASLLGREINPKSCHYAERQSMLRTLLPNVRPDFQDRVQFFHIAMNVKQQYVR